MRSQPAAWLARLVRPAVTTFLRRDRGQHDDCDRQDHMQDAQAQAQAI